MRLGFSNADILCSPGQQDYNGCETWTPEGQHAGFGVFERVRESTEAQDFGDVQSFPAPKWSSIRTIRLLFDGTRLLFDFAQLILNLLYDNITDDFIADISVAGILILWDLSEKFYLKSDSPCIIVSKTSIFIEVAIPVGIVVLMYFSILDIKVEYDRSLEWFYDGSSDPSILFQIPVVLLWAPILIMSGVLLYHLVISYIQARRRHKLRPIIVFTSTGDPVAVIPRPRPRPSNDSASRISIDSLIQTSEESGLQEVRVL
ncbi:hypothetical protein F5Y00DRAFT_262130 [Daldinia vernicosa]|uniref:uncharacterized protein n=1 Tax=Daldinia vernicosa TaxID=114800 RepID=UPI00200846B0|nr:uncharacterized protein F5Y00DRAFT_262130 [Daldinia vernicosa]KAI0848972.1 hypothetical protein F5Y00DRAFT_262130 [Daldinia vernicosa]